MSQQGEAAEQIVNMATNVTVKGVECATNLVVLFIELFFGGLYLYCICIFHALFAAAMYAALCFSSFANQIRVYDSLLSAFS